MKPYPIYLLQLIFLSASCTGQVKPPTPPSAPPVIIRKPDVSSLSPGTDTSLVSQYIRSIFQDSKGNLWFGTIENGVVKYGRDTLTYYSASAGFKSNSVFAIIEDKAGNLWFGTDQGVYKYDGNTFRNYRQPEGLGAIDISRKGILVDRSGTIWVGTHKGVYRYIPEADKPGLPCFKLFEQLPLINCAGILEDRKGNLWFASSDQGVFRFDGKSVFHLTGKEQLSENYAGGIAEDSAGNLWFTMKNGFTQYDGTRFTDYTAKDGIGGTEIWGLLIEPSGIIWITARGSTTRFDPSLPLSKAFTVFTPEDGFTCCVQSLFQDRSGRLWFGTGQGLYRFDGKRFDQVKQTGPWPHP